MIKVVFLLGLYFSVGSWGLAMLVAVKRGLYVLLFQSLCNFLPVKIFLKFDEQSAYVCNVS